MADTNFINGLDLSESFYNEAVEPLLREYYPNLRHAAALIGSGSEVLGFDDRMSADHHWGPRVMLFVSQKDLTDCKAAVSRTLTEKLPRRFRGYPTSYIESTAPDDQAIQMLNYGEDGLINHRVELLSIHDFISDYLGFDMNQAISPADWLTFPEQKLLAITAGRVFRDEVGLNDLRRQFAYYPPDVWLYLLASCWTRIEQDEHLMGRTGLVGDEIGSSIIGSRLVRDLMRLCFLMERRYAPYSKWFGTAFRKLVAGRVLEPTLERALSAGNWRERQSHLSKAYKCVATLHNQLNITEPLPTEVSQFHDRPFFVISMGVFSKAITSKISDPVVREIAKRPLIGGIDLFSDSTDILANAAWHPALRELYTVKPPDTACK